MRDFLEILARDARETVAEGYYKGEQEHERTKVGIRESILQCRRNPIIAEIKTVSPSSGTIAHHINIKELASTMQRGGATCLSILTEPKHFGGRTEYLVAAAECGLPILMKDIIVDPMQVDVAAKLGARGILLIKTMFDKGLTNAQLEEMIELAHREELEVLLETHTEEEFEGALNSESDLIGINNRDLTSLKTDLQVTKNILDACSPRGRTIVSESGIYTAEHIRFLRGCGARAFLVGSSIMQAPDPEKKVRELVEA